jgi:hypothetical protein
LNFKFQTLSQLKTNRSPSLSAMSVASAETKMSNLLSSSKGSEIETLTLDNLEEALANDTKIKLAGVDIDGILRGKIVSKKKFLSVAKDGFGFCSVIFGCELHAHFTAKYRTNFC